MMRAIHLIAVSIFLIVSACNKLDLDDDTPDCIADKIREFRKQSSTCDNNASVEKYSFLGTTVFTFSPGNCGADFLSPVYNEHCDELGALGGISGNTQINGVEFGDQATLVAILWSN